MNVSVVACCFSIMLLNLINKDIKATLTTDSLKLFWKTLICICILYHSPHWNGTGNWNPSSWRTRVCLSHIIKMRFPSNMNDRQTSSISHTKSKNLFLISVCKLSLHNPLKPCVKWSINMKLEQCQQAMLQQVFWLLRVSYIRGLMVRWKNCWLNRPLDGTLHNVSNGNTDAAT